MSPTRYLVQRADRLGDVILVLPVIEQLRTYDPTAHIAVLTSSIGSRLLNNVPSIDQVIIVEDDSWSYYRSLIKRVKDDSFDVYISLWNHPRWAWFGKLCNIKCRIGDSTNISLTWLYTRTIRQHWEDITRHQIEFNTDLLRPLGITPQLKPAQIPVNPDSKSAVQQRLKKTLDPSLPLVVIFTATGGTNFPIPPDAVKSFCEKLMALKGFNIVLLGQGDAQNWLPDQLLRSKQVLNWVNDTTFDELIATISLADYYIGPDTGPTHFASFMGKPMIFFSSMKPNAPSRWGSLSPYLRIIREEYHCPYLCVKGCHPSECFSFCTGQRLYDEFCEIVHQVNQQEAKSLAQTRNSHLKHTFRVLYIARSSQEFDQGCTVCKSFQKEGFQTFVYHLPRCSIFELPQLCRWVVTHNINIIQGRVPRYLILAIQLYMGIVCQYIKPIFVQLPLQPFIKLSDYFDVYQKQWATHR